ncbi:hypothetical protein [Pseudoalteromonas sp. S16_S37]|uniref:hypothetical protein n=1 Tax=Pseudoalteromonas sp. S16_S37 TaxID=2720228 RepID=UPI0016810E31|nr:hypothetical protein [Pseudoalteromonas sp. S16_S37]MBD1581432.1 hypothetical protein [Pseudoalteromonas sp. S16_S37]
MNIGAIDWPSNSKAAIELYLNFLIKVIKANNIRFPNKFQDPIDITNGYLEGNIPVDIYRESANEWWNYIDSSGQIQEFSNSDALVARVAICLLSVTDEDVPELGEHLSWFFEVLENLGIDLDSPIEQMCEYFPFKK